MESASIAKPEIPKEKIIENKEKIITLTFDKKAFTIEFKNEIEYLSVVASYQDRLFPVKYTGKFYLSDIKKVELFRDYESIDECLFEIFEGLDSNPTLIEKDNLNIIITVPLHKRKYPEIIFNLSKFEKKEMQKYDKLINIFMNIKSEKDKEIKELKDKIHNLEKLLNIIKEKNKIKEESEDQLDETKIEIFNIGKNEYLDYFPEKNQYKKNLFGIAVSIAFECNEKDNRDIVEAFNKNKDDIEGILGFSNSVEFNIRVNKTKNKIFIDMVFYNETENEKEVKKKKDFLFDEVINNETYPLLLGFMINGMKVILKTKLNLVDISEIKDEEKLDNLIYNTKIDFKGDIITCKIFLSLLILYIHILNDKDKQNDNDNIDDDINNNKNNDHDKDMIKEIIDLVNDIFLTVINGNNNYTLNKKEILDNFKEVKKYIFSLIKSITIESINMFKDPKYSIFKKINFNKINVGILGSPKYNVGLFGINFESPKNNEFIDKVLNGTIKLGEERENKENINREGKKEEDENN